MDGVRGDPADRRAYRLFLTEAARPVVADFRAIAYDVVMTALAGVSDAEIDIVTDVLSRVRANLVGKPDESDAAASVAAPPLKMKVGGLS